MGPVRTKKPRGESNDASSSAVAGPSKIKPAHRKPTHDSGATPGLQKLKSSLRQTRRLLAKDKLAADVRVETERRLKALEADLEVAELGKKERALAVRYHKVKFFERQKVVRKLNQTKKKISAGDTPELQSKLHALRVDLNYILHYPKTKKYISLFPPELRKGETQEPANDAGRDEVRAWVTTQMASGEVSAEPELHLDARGGGGAADWGVEEKRKRKDKGEPEPEMDVDPEDAFFGDDDDDDADEH
ncbi:hypothetical protein B0H15DRAFT_543577 [Mycena belliarum]|uniref:rRNA-processing protein EFG1 n=1 Tax=Mycena belliarum TaxID=1033014 RepID=A0AAD6UD79_9AGAR|nr:hypothetical protein B0H15DRAFT_543577 [Mycena belliae]